MATPIQDLHAQKVLWSAKKPLKSKQEPTTTNSYIEGGPFYFAIHGSHRKAATLNPAKLPPGEKVSAADRARAVQDLPVFLSDGHITGDKYQQPNDPAPTGLLKISDDAASVIESWQQWAKEEILSKQKQWGLSEKSAEVLQAQFIDQLSYKDGSAAVSVKWYRDDIQIFVQDRDRPWVMRRGGTSSDLTKGSRVEAIGRFGGIRMKAKEWSLQKIILERIYIYTCGGNHCPDIFDEEDMDGIEYEDEIGSKGTSMDVDEPEESSHNQMDELDGTTMIGM